MDNAQTKIITRNVRSYLALNTKLLVSPVSFSDADNVDTVYDSRIEDIDSNELYISIPTNKGIPLVLSKGVKISVSIWSPNGRIAFDSHIIGVKQCRFSRYIRLPIPMELRKIQLRSFYRVDTYLKIKMYKMNMATYTSLIENSDPEYEDVVLIDLSGGGAKVSVTSFLKEGEIVILDLIGSAADDIGMLECIVVRSVCSESKYFLSLSFVNMSSAQQDKIVRYVFKRQIELKDIKQG